MRRAVLFAAAFAAGLVFSADGAFAQHGGGSEAMEVSVAASMGAASAATEVSAACMAAAVSAMATTAGGLDMVTMAAMAMEGTAATTERLGC